jgi:ankyrin repeat protein
MTEDKDILVASSVGDIVLLEKSLHGRENDINEIVDKEGYTPFQLAACRRNLSVLKYLISTCNSLDVNISTTSSSGNTPLHLILQNDVTSDIVNGLKCLQLLLKHKAMCNRSRKVLID